MSTSILVLRGQAAACQPDIVIARESLGGDLVTPAEYLNTHTEWCEKTVLHSGTQELLSPWLHLSLCSPSDASHWLKWTAGGLQMVSAGITSDTWGGLTLFRAGLMNATQQEHPLVGYILVLLATKRWTLNVTVRSKKNIDVLIVCWTSNEI